MTIIEDLKSGRLVVVPPVSVKPLEWANHDGSYWYAKCPVTGKEYGVTFEEGKWWSVWDCAAKPEASADPLRAAAQADYEARILSALTASPDHTAGLIALVEGMAAEREDLRLGIISLIWLPGVRAALDKLPPGDGLQKHMARLEELVAAEARALAAEAESDRLRRALEDARAESFYEGLQAAAEFLRACDDYGDRHKAERILEIEAPRQALKEQTP